MVKYSSNAVSLCELQSFQLPQDFIQGMDPRPLTMFYENGLLILEYHSFVSKRSKLRISMFAHNGLIDPASRSVDRSFPKFNVLVHCILCTIYSFISPHWTQTTTSPNTKLHSHYHPLSTKVSYSMNISLSLSQN